MGEWIEWSGGKQPVADGVMVNWRVEYEREVWEETDVVSAAAEDLCWKIKGDENDIVAYRVVA